MTPQTHAERLLWLAGLEMACPDCQGYDASLRSQGLSHNPATGLPLCQRCNKQGQVPRFPLRQECGCGGRHDFVRIRSLDKPDLQTGLDWETLAKDLPCPDCEGRGWKPVEDLEASLKALEDGGLWFHLQGDGMGHCAAFVQGAQDVAWGAGPNEAVVLALYRKVKSETP